MGCLQAVFKVWEQRQQDIFQVFDYYSAKQNIRNDPELRHVLTEGVSYTACCISPVRVCSSYQHAGIWRDAPRLSSYYQGETNKRCS